MALGNFRARANSNAENDAGIDHVERHPCGVHKKDYESRPPCQ